jgi:poly(3-hydroxybutyrate) depolymerase
MLSLTRIQLLSFAAAGALVALTAASAPARSEERPVRLGPVGPNEPIFTTVGNKNIIAFYVPGDGHCNIQVVMNDRTDASGGSAAQLRVTLNPRQSVLVDAADNHTVSLKCGENAATLSVIDGYGHTVFGSSVQEPIQASAAGWWGQGG